MKKIMNFTLFLFLGLASMGQEPVLTEEQNLEDYDFAVKYIEDNYAGFPDKVVDSTRADYEAMKARVRNQVANGERPGWEAVAEYTAWFEDFHLKLHYNFTDNDGYRKGYNEKYWTRQKTHYEGMMEYNPLPIACKVTNKTFLIRFPSCDGNPDMKWVKNSIKQFKKSQCENLIIDIRGNVGGNDRFFGPYLKLLYDHEGAVPSSEFRNTVANMRQLPLAIKKKAAKNPESEFVAYLDTVDKLWSIRYDKRDCSVGKAALIIDNSIASSGEQMASGIRATSARTTIYGRDNTMGCLDYSSLVNLEMPNCQIYFSCPMSRIMGLPETSIDKNGIASDVRIDLPLPAKLTDNIDEWVIWVAEELEK